MYTTLNAFAPRDLNRRLFVLVGLLTLIMVFPLVTASAQVVSDSDFVILSAKNVQVPTPPSGEKFTLTVSIDTKTDSFCKYRVTELCFFCTSR